MKAKPTPFRFFFSVFQVSLLWGVVGRIVRVLGRAQALRRRAWIISRRMVEWE